jgi:hypothetical protein
MMNMEYVSHWKNVDPLRFFSAAGIYLFAFAILSFAGGCSSQHAEVSFKSTTSNRQYSQQFQKAYFTRTASAEYDAVLVDDGVSESRHGSSGPIKPTPAAPLSQILHIRVRWRPLRGSKSDTPTATNAVIDWYILASDPANRDDYLHYRGAGFVKVSENGNEARFDIDSAHLDVAESGGKLQDPLGASSVSGGFFAERNDALVKSTIKSVRSSIPDSATHQGPPPRMPPEP